MLVFSPPEEEAAAEAVEVEADPDEEEPPVVEHSPALGWHSSRLTERCIVAGWSGRRSFSG